ncbi:MAG: hypothetical protein R8G66_02265 [Cytophagales bacterium]|nr:hypothetical protein [Cytophagales bacterium]
MKRLIWMAIIILGVVACSDEMNDMEIAKQESNVNEVGNYWD